MRVLFTVVLFLSMATAAAAGPPQFELKGSLGYALSEGISISGEEVNNEFYNRLDVDDGLTFGAGLGVYISRNMELAFLWDVQQSELVAKGSTTMSISSMDVYNYHGAFIYNFGSFLDNVRPIVFGGLGSTYFSSLKFTDLQGRPQDTGGKGKFSTIWGAGVKFFPASRIGFQLDFKWTPTYIKSEPGGYWCDPYWGCGTTTRTDYANQWKFGGTLIARF